MSRAPETSSEGEAFNELCAYTLAHALGDESFIHQHVVDAFAAQRADDRSKPIAVTFALVGLYLHAERRFSGRQVQRIHGILARKRSEWPSYALPQDRGSITAATVMAAAPGPERDRAIEAWCACVWAAFAGSRHAIIDWLKQRGID